jgi:hypothetical protein
MNIGLGTATSTTQSSTVDSVWKEGGLHIESKDRVEIEVTQHQRPENAWGRTRPSPQQQQQYQHQRQQLYPQQQQQQPYPIQQRNLQQRYQEEQYRLGQPEDDWYPRPTLEPGHILVSGETTTEQRIVIKNNPFRFGRKKKPKDSDDSSPSAPDLERQRQGERRAIEEQERKIPEEERGVIKNSPWRVARRKKGGSWLPLALFGSKSSLDRFESDTDESVADPDGAQMRGRLVVRK